ncbi:MAG: hypothetical protein PHX68_01610 [Alphaproteobacteria bacterium]|nr:hypothetical protein [Alphaproteobacteria bacterium]
MKKTLLIGIAGALCLGLAACQPSDPPRTEWARDVDTTLNVPPINTGGTSKTAPYEHCNYGETCAVRTQKTIVERTREPGKATTTMTRVRSGAQND